MSLLSNIDKQLEDQSIFYNDWLDWIETNYYIHGDIIIHNNIVDIIGTIVIRNKNLTQLTNGQFEFGSIMDNLDYHGYYIAGTFGCGYCYDLISLDGAPKKVDGNFYCFDCKKLITLKGAPEYVGRDFDCSGCISLTTLDGAPKKIGGFFKN